MNIPSAIRFDSLPRVISMYLSPSNPELVMTATESGECAPGVTGDHQRDQDLLGRNIFEEPDLPDAAYLNTGQIDSGAFQYIHVGEHGLSVYWGWKYYVRLPSKKMAAINITRVKNTKMPTRIWVLLCLTIMSSSRR
jgi:hypothetical protein